ncbi:MAG TPA: SIS domain-containing protein [Actinomycetota bacterium]|jgi:fructoselysine-6-P-deglycase FrlB-like protein|nr:SIS domain-containing protein [Actinomycetota bacterium]
MSETAQEVASQPGCWRRAAGEAPRVADVLPERGERVAVTGCGTSLFMARAFAGLREAGGHGETDAFPASEFPVARGYDRIVAISRSGTTSEVVRLLERLRGRRTTAITAVEGSPVTALADATVALGFADERSVVQTRFATSTLALLRAHLGQEIAPVIDEAEGALAGPVDADALGAQHVVFLGHGWSVGIAEEAALKLREGARSYTEAYPAMEYRHGPISLADARTFAWVLGSPDASVADDVRAAGAAVHIATLDPMAELVRVHRLTLALAERRGLDPDRPRHLTRSVVLS